MEIPELLLTEMLPLKSPFIIGVSGFEGSGKSTFASELGTALGAPVIGVDSFMKDRTIKDYSHWEVVDFTRLSQEVIEPFLTGAHTMRYGHFDWGTNSIIESKEVHHQGIIIIEGVGLFRPEINDYLAYKIWVDCSLEEALLRGKKRDHEIHQSPQDEKWDGIWKKNDEECYTTYSSKRTADFVLNKGGD